MPHDRLASPMRNNPVIATVSGLVLWLAVCFVVAAVGASASLQAGVFYAELIRPDWAPPAAVFGPVWTALYAMMAVAAWLIWERREARLARIALAVFVLQLILNALWSWLFFGWRQGAWSFVDIAFLWLSIVVALVLFLRIRPLAGLLLVPYLAWVTFASALNYRIWQLNPSSLA
jgi:benzodiazapine receptor